MKVAVLIAAGRAGRAPKRKATTGIVTSSPSPHPKTKVKMTEPYYQDDLVTLYHGDCFSMDVMYEWLRGDVLIFDPPYGIDYQSGYRRENLAASILNDKDTTVRDRVLGRWNDGRPALVFGSWKIERPAETKTRLIWDTKGALGMGDLRIPWKPSDQEIYVLGDGPWRGARSNNVLSFAPVQATAKNGRKHPHEKPVRLMAELIAKTFGTVVDPTSGSGSTLVAAKMLGRRSIGVEMDEGYCEETAKRLSQQAFDFEAIA
jgi:hypothetical protein